MDASLSLSTVTTGDLSNKPQQENITQIVLSGTYGTVTFKVLGSADGTNFFDLSCIDRKTGAIIQGGTTISPSDNSVRAFLVPSDGLTHVRISQTAIASGTAVYKLNSYFQAGDPFVVINNTGSTTASLQTFSAGITVNGATGVNAFSIPDNLADALSIKEGSTAYLTFTTTDSAELINVLKTLKFGGTTGNNIISLVDNLADALSVKEGSTAYLTFVTTDSGEAIHVKKPVVLTGTLTAGGLLTTALQVCTSGPLVYSGSGAPSISAAVKGSLYLRSDGSNTANRAYIATDTAGNWTALSTAG